MPTEIATTEPQEDEAVEFPNLPGGDADDTVQSEAAGDASSEDTAEEPAGQETAPWTGEAALWQAELGLTAEDMEKYTPEDFAGIADKMYSAVARNSGGRKAVQQAGFPQSAPPQEDTQYGNQYAPAGGEPELPSVPEIDVSDLDEPSAKAVSALKDTVASQQKQLKQFVDVLSDMHKLVSERSQSDEQFQAAQEWDGRFSRIDRPDIFGEGSSLSGGLSKEQQERRWFLAHAVRAEREAMAQSGDVLPPEDIHAHRKAQQIFGSIATGAIRRAAEDSKKVASSATLSGKSARQTPGPQDDASTIAAWRKRHNISAT